MYCQKGAKPFRVFTVMILVLAWVGALPALFRTLDRVVATVDEEVLTQSELQEAVELFVHQLGQTQKRMPNENEMKAVERRVLEDMIDKKLLEAHAEEVGVTASEEDVDRAIDDVLSRANLTREQLQEALKRDGIRQEEYRDQIRNQIVKAKMIHQEIRNRINIKDVDIEGYYLDHSEQFRTEEGVVLRHILLPLPKEPSPDEVKAAYEESVRIRDEVIAGTPFEEAAVKYSKDSSAAQGGWLGFFGRGSMSPEMEAAVWKLKEGEVSQPVRSPMGFHLIKLQEKTTGELRSLDKVRDMIREKLYEEAAERQFEEWRRELRKNAHIEVFM